MGGLAATVPQLIVHKALIFFFSVFEIWPFEEACVGQSGKWKLFLKFRSREEQSKYNIALVI